MPMAQVGITINHFWRPWLLALGGALVLGLAPAPARAVGFVGFNGGIAFPSSSSGAFAWGFNVAFQLKPLIAPGVFFTKYGVSVDASTEDQTGTSSASSFYYGGELNLFPQGSLKGFIASFRLGLVNFSTSVDAADSSTSIAISNQSTKLFFGPRIAYDVPIGRFSAGGDLSYYIGLGGDAPKSVNLLAAVKFWW